MLDLGEAVRLALRNATPVRLAQEDARLAAAQLLLAHGQFLPAAGIGVRAYGQSGNALLGATALEATDATLYGVNSSLSVGMTVFDGARTREALRAAVARQEAAGLTLDRAREEVALDITRTWYRILLADRLSGVAGAALTLSRTREAQLDAQVRAGTKAPPDLFRQQAQTRADEAAMLSADAQGRAARIALLERLHLDPLRRLVVRTANATSDSVSGTTTIRSDTLNADVLAHQALAARADVGAVAASRRAAESLVGAARSGRLPRVFAEVDVVNAGRVFDHAVRGSTDLLATDAGRAQRGLVPQLGAQTVGVLSVGVSVPLFDQWRTRVDVEAAEVAVERSRLAEEEVRARVQGDIARAVDDVRTAEQTILASRAQVDAAERAFAAVSGRYAVGMATFVDVSTAQQALIQARAALEQAVVAQGLAAAQLQVSLGRMPNGTANARP
jgi:outer membrane protein